jgi:hypothetical protein
VIDELADSLQTVTLLATKLRRSPSAGSAPGGTFEENSSRGIASRCRG